MLSICSYSEYSKMSFELLETILVTQKELPPKLASGILKNGQRKCMDCGFSEMQADNC
jgi:hypothetical protein